MSDKLMPLGVAIAMGGVAWIFFAAWAGFNHPVSIVAGIIVGLFFFIMGELDK